MRGRALPPTDREVMLAEQDELDAAAYALQQIEHGRTLGRAAAAYVVGMWEGLGETSGLSKEEKLVLIQAALRGR